MLSGSTVDFTSFFQSVGTWIVNSFPGLYDLIRTIFGIVIGLSFPFSLLFVIGIIYCVERLKSIRKQEAAAYELKVEPAYEKVENNGDPVLANKWENVTKLVESASESDWRQAIIGADVILDDILTKMGYRGESVGEKLKRASPSDFASLDDAWEAHKVRNRIAHDGQTFPLNQHEARQVIQRYRRVFEEFFYI